MDETTNTTEVAVGGSTVDSASEAVQMLQAAMDGTQPEAVEAQEQQKPAAEPEAQKQEEKFAAKFAALSRKEKALRQKEMQLEARLKQMEEQFKAKETEVTSKYIDPERFRKEPLKVMQETGLSFEQLAEMVLNDGKPTQDMILSEYEKKVMSKVQELEKKLAEKEAKEQEERYNAALQQFQAQLTDFVNKTEDYELIRANDSVDLVFQVIEQHHEETGEILSNKEACDAVEAYLLEEAKKLVDRNKVKKLLQPEQAPKAQNGQQTGAKTLSNAAAASAPPKSTSRRLSDDESKAEAAKLLRWDD